MKRIKDCIRGVPLVLAVLFLCACIEEFQPQTNLQSETKELLNALVVDGLLTDEMKQHEVVLARAFSFEQQDPVPETNATVNVTSSNGDVFRFLETEPGVYRSQTVFAASHNTSYELEITTQDGSTYSSSVVAMPDAVSVGELEAKRMVSDNGRDGVGIFVGNTPNFSGSTFFRYEFEETYKIIAPRWEPQRFEVVRYAPCFPNPFQVELVLWEDERRICFGNRQSRRTIQTSSVELTGNQIQNFQLQFIDAENYIISHRYSIMVRQFSQTQDAYSFYEQLSDFTSSDNIFSQIQPGFLEGNMTAKNNGAEKVLGYFEVASVSTKRLYFNYQDLFPGEDLPPYPGDCDNLNNPRIISRSYHCLEPGVCDGNCTSPLINQIRSGVITFAGTREDFLRPYYTWPSACGDCTKLGSNIVPEFWVEE